MDSNKNSLIQTLIKLFLFFISAKSTESSLDIHTCRRTCGQYLADRLEIEDVSVNLGHSSTRTTERYYGRRSKKISSDRVRALYEEEFETSQTCEKSIEKEGDFSAPDGI